MLNNEIPFFRIGLPLCLGIISGLYLKPDNTFLFVSASLICSGYLTSLYYNKLPSNQIFGYSIIFSLYICGLLLYTFEKNSISTLRKEPTYFSCNLSDFPEEREKNYRFTVKLSHRITQSGEERLKGSMILYINKDSSLASFLPGDKMVIRCTPIEIVNRGNPNEFDYRFFMENHGIRYYAFINSKNIIKKTTPDRRKLSYKALIIREKIIEMYRERGINGDRLALVAAITLGQKKMLEPEQKQHFIKAGVMHIMAVSGLHAVILSMFVFNLLFFMKKKMNYLRIIITILFLWSFAFVTGLTPSVLRATLMFSFLQAGNLMNRRVNGINSVLASAFVLILIRPSVIFDAGFLLSYSAVIYIIVFYRDFYLKLQFKNWLSDKIWQSVVVTLVAQAGTLPLTIMLFNRFPTYFIITNIIIVPLSSILIIVGCLVPLFYPVVFLSRTLASMLDWLSWLTEKLTSMASSIPYSTIENIGMTSFHSILLTITIFLFSYWLLKKPQISIHYPLTALFFLATGDTIMEIKNRTNNELIIYNTPGIANIGFKTGKNLYLYSDTSASNAEVSRHCATLGLKIKASVIGNTPNYITAGGKKVLICNSPDNYTLNQYMPDIVIITGNITNNVMLSHLTKTPEKIIVLTDGQQGFFNRINVNTDRIDTLHFVRNSGAYISGF